MCEGKVFNQSVNEQTVIYALNKYIKLKGYPPTFRELTEICEFHSTSTTSRYLNILKSKGIIDYTPKIPRSIRFLK
ncbi:LexA family protein [Priestia aryabhattai]|uniref:LexA family protein n=1 Tax=Priestia aryabhattai TaxID=412384 RepID=UPI00398ED089